MPYIIREKNIIEVQIREECVLVEILSPSNDLIESIVVPKSEIFNTLEGAKIALKQKLLNEIINLQQKISQVSNTIETLDAKEKEV